MEVIAYEEIHRNRVLDLDINKVEQAELKALTGMSPREALEDSLKMSDYTWFAEDKGKVIAVGGLTLHTLEEGIGVPWLLSNDEFTMKHLFTINSLTYSLMKHSFDTLGLYLLTNQVSLDNRPSIKWLKYLGFEFMEQPRLINGVWFDSFYMYKEDYNV